MKKTTIGILLLPLIAVSGLEAETFVHKFKKGEKYRIVATVEEKVLQNDEPVGTAAFLNKIAVTITDVVKDSGRVSALYQISERRESDEGSYQLGAEEKAAFTIDPQGRYAVGLSSFYPPVHDIPRFPSSDINPDFVWTAPGAEVFDLREAYGIRSPVKIPVNAVYTFLGVEEGGGKRLAKIGIEYEYRHDVKGVRAKAGQLYPVKISGAHSMVYVWNIAAGKPDSYREEFYVLYNLSDGQWIEYMGTAQGEVILSEPLDKKETVEEIQQEIDKEKLEGVKVEQADQGVKITLENIQFEPDSDRITEAEAHKIETIASILKKYPDRDVKLVGHTAAVGTPESCLELSVRRAKAVGDALIERAARTPEQMTIQGKGLTEPLATNQTEAGRIKNRRVEIFLLEN